MITSRLIHYWRCRYALLFITNLSAPERPLIQIFRAQIKLWLSRVTFSVFLKFASSLSFSLSIYLFFIFFENIWRSSISFIN